MMQDKRDGRWRLAILAAALLSSSAAIAGDGDEDAPEWEVDEERAPYSDLRFEADEGTWISVDVSPDGAIVFDLLGHLYELPGAGGAATRLTSGRAWDMFPRYSPDGGRIAFTSDRGGQNALWVLDRATGEVEQVSELEHPVFQGSWSRDGKFLYGTALDQKVRLPAYRFHVEGGNQELIPAGDRIAVNHFEEHPTRGLVYFEAQGRDIYRQGPTINSYDLETGEVEVYLQRPGGAVNPALSRDGRYLAYVHRDDLETVLVVHDLDQRTDRTLVRNLDRGRLESGGFYGAYPNIAWTPDGAEVVYSAGGGLRAVRLADGEVRRIPFTARVERQIDDTLRVRLDLPTRTAPTRSHRWGVPTAKGVVFETLGDLWLRAPDGSRANLTGSDAHETNPVVHAPSGKLYYATWQDDGLGAVFVRGLAGGETTRLTTLPSQYGALAVSPDGERVAAIRGDGAIRRGTRLERQTGFELVLLGAGDRARKVTEITWNHNRYARRPPTVRFASTGERLYFTEFEDDVLTLKSIHPDGIDEQVLYEFPHATRAVLSPDLDWLAYREYHRSFVTPFSFAGKTVVVSAADKQGFSVRVDPADGDFTEWTDDGDGLYWTRGGTFYEKRLADVLAEKDGAVTETPLAFDFEVTHPQGTVALTSVRVLTMDRERTVIEDATVVIEDDRIAAVGKNVAVPDGAKVFDLPGRTVMPGMFDAHGHYGSPVSALNVIEQRLYGLHANLAYGVTTMIDVYGTTQKDFWVSDMLRAGAISGPRIFSVGDPIFVTKYRTKMYRPIDSLDDALEHARFNRDHGAPALKDYSNHTRAARQQLVAACRELGLNLVTESFNDPQMNLTQVIDGFTGIEHTMGLVPLYDDVVKLFAATDVQMTPTLIVVYGGPSGERYFHQAERPWEDAKLRRFYRKEELVSYRRPGIHLRDDDFFHMEMARDLLKLHRAGVRLNMGAHGQMMGLGAHWEMEMFVHGGFTPHEAIAIATINGYRHHGLDHELGSLEAGKLADLVVLEENPLEDIRNTRAIEYVMKNGVLYAGSDAARVHPDPRPAGKMYFFN